MSTDYPKLVTGMQMAQIDRCSIDEHGIPGLELMERAGAEVVEVIRDRSDGLEGLSVAVVCGKGNNGGDGLVVARLLHEAGVKVRAFLTSPRDAQSPDTAHNLSRLADAGLDAEPYPRPESGTAELRQADVIVDAILGTGFKGSVRAELAGVIEQINAAGQHVVAVDLPSGVEADTGKVHGVCVNASVTVTFGLAKIGHLFFPGRSFCGDLELADIGFPPEAVATCPIRTFLISAEAVAAALPNRAPDAHKGSCGSVAVIAGSVGMTGAAVLTADSALLCGAGRVSLGVPASLNDIMEIKLTEVMTKPLPEVRHRRCLSLRALGEIEAMLDKRDCLAVGPGLGTYRETTELVRRLVARQLTGRELGSRKRLPIVIDADGINAFSGFTDILKKGDVAHPLVLTPHVGEFARLTGTDKAALCEQPLEHARAFATEYGVILVLKGAPTLVALPDGRVMVNPTGNAGMATAGSGDVLTGTIAGLIAQGLPADDAACAGVFLHGLSGDLARDQLGQWGMKAGDISQCLPQAVFQTASPERLAALTSP